MNTTPSQSSTVIELEAEPDSTFRSIFAPKSAFVELRVPDYQRAYSWEEKQVGLFLSDLEEYEATGRPYYFGHFIVENRGNCWELVDGQQRINTYVLFLLVCRHHHAAPLKDSAVSLLKRFCTVSYDADAFKCIVTRLGDYLALKKPFDPKRPPKSEILREAFALPGEMTRSPERIILALLQMDRAFQKGLLDPGRIPGYLDVIMEAHCSHHLTRDKSVAVNVFEMHNTRGVPLRPLEVVKAILMKFVYDHGDTETERDDQVRKIQQEFGRIYGMEERLARQSFRGEMTIEQLLRNHLRVVDDGSKKEAGHYHSPATNASGDALVEYVRKRLHYADDEKSLRDSKSGVAYALDLTRELANSMEIVSKHLPDWDKACGLVGDVLILEPSLSCEFFLIVCRRLASQDGSAYGILDDVTLNLWEKLLFTRDFHSGYYNLKGGRDDFPSLFASCGPDEDGIASVIRTYLADGFRPDRTPKLQSMVANYLTEYQPSILTGAFYWWKAKMIYAIYKYEISMGAKLRDVMKGTVSVEHIIPQDWHWIRDEDVFLKEMSSDQWERFHKEIDACIHGIGNLLLITPGENTSVGNHHPAKKEYQKYCSGGSYKEHDVNREKWLNHSQWQSLIRERGLKIFRFMLITLVDTNVSSSQVSENHKPADDMDADGTENNFRPHQ